MKRRAIIVFGVCLTIAGLWLADLLAPAGFVLPDLRVRALHRPPSAEIAVVEIDSQSLAALGRWPWRRRVYADAIDRLVEAGASAIAIDIDFSAPAEPDEDAALEAALARSGGAVILPAFRQRGSDAASEVMTAPLERFARNAWVALVDVRPDADGRVRQFPEAADVAGQSYVSMPLMLAGVEARSGRQFTVDFSIDTSRIERIAFADLIAGKVPPERLKGRRIILGATATELHDFLPVPVHGNMAGPVLVALAANAAILDRRLYPAPAPLTLGLLFFIAIGALIVGRRMPMSASLSLAGSSAVLIEALALFEQDRGELIIDTVPWHLALLVFCVLAVVSEIRERRRALSQSRREKEDLRLILDRVITNNLEGVIIADSRGRVRSSSLTAQTLLGFSGGAGLGRTLADILPGPLLQAVDRATDAYRQGRQAPNGSFEVVLETNASAPRTLECALTATTLTQGGGQGLAAPADFVLCILLRDITERKLAQKRIERMAAFDMLTGLRNRRSFFECLRATIDDHADADSPLALFYLDLDGFKAINDTFGHATGDAVLQQVASRIGACLAEADTPARLGGDEFAVILRSQPSMAQVEAAAQRMSAAIRQPFQVNGYVVSCGVSIGIAEVRGSDEVSSVVARADASLYQAKSAGGSKIRLYDEQLAAAMQERRILEDDLRHALARGEIWVAYQPQVDLATRQMIGVEALARWIHPTMGLVSPVIFIEVAEQIGLISAIGEYVLAQACKDAADWPASVKVSVNVSPAQFMLGDFPARCDRILKSERLAPERLVLEITESIFIGEPLRVMEALEALRGLGIEIAIDDFGTGYSSLSYLKRFPIDKIKIDQSFVRDIADEAASLGIVQAVTMLAQTLGVSVIAEGVEHEQQVDFLRLLGCNEGQGFLFGRPVAAHKIRHMLSRPELEGACSSQSAA